MRRSGLGGSGSDAADASSLALDGNGIIYVGGGTSSANFPTVPPGTNKAIPFPTTPDAIRRVSAGSIDCTLTVLDLARPPSQQIVYSTLFGGVGTDWALQGKRLASGRFFVGGCTNNASGFPVTMGAYDTTHNGDSDGFVIRLDF